MREKGHLT
uniref:Uncharacterized protein n=1 Tax=Arundo donax TaxID=35708 RepID=A0A0A9AFF4_ARUDO